MKKVQRLSASTFALTLALSLFSPQTKAYNDVPADSWYAPYVLELEQAGIVDSADKFRPADNLNRAEFVKMIIKALKEDGKEALPGHPTFDDVPLSAWFAPFVERAATLAIISGYADQDGNLTGWFGPADAVTRAQAVKILVEGFNLATKENQAAPTAYSDVASNEWFYEYVYIASSLGIVEGYEGGVFKPNQAVKRSEMAKMLSLAMAVARGEVLIPPTPNTPSTPDSPTPPSDPQQPESPQQGEVFKPNLTPLNSGIAVAGETQKLVARYSFQGQLEGFKVDTLTLVNDTTGNTLGDDLKASSAIKNITLKFPDKNGLTQVATKNLDAQGNARFTGLNFYVQKDTDTNLEVYVDVNNFSEIDEKNSGEEFRIGLKTINTIDSFKALGEFSQSSVTLNNEDLILSTSNQALYTLRKSKPTFEIVKKQSLLSNGTQTLLGLKVTADKNGSISLGRLTFDVQVNDDDNANLALNDFQWFDDSELLENVSLYDASGMQDLSQNGGGSLTNGEAQVLVSFNEEMIISAGQSKTFYLKASATGVSDGDLISSKLRESDENSPLSGLTSVGQPNTGKLYVSGDVTAGIFTGAPTDFSQLLGVNQSILWSDLSAQPHQYPQISNGSVTSDTGSADWTNGHKLGISALEASILTK